MVIWTTGNTLYDNLEAAHVDVFESFHNLYASHLDVYLKQYQL